MRPDEEKLPARRRRYKGQRIECLQKI